MKGIQDDLNSPLIGWCTFLFLQTQVDNKFADKVAAASWTCRWTSWWVEPRTAHFMRPTTHAINLIAGWRQQCMPDTSQTNGSRRDTPGNAHPGKVFQISHSLASLVTGDWAEYGSAVCFFKHYFTWVGVGEGSGTWLQPPLLVNVFFFFKRRWMVDEWTFHPKHLKNKCWRRH